MKKTTFKNKISIETKGYSVKQTMFEVTSNNAKFKMGQDGLISIVLTNSRATKKHNTHAIGYYLGGGRFVWDTCRRAFSEVWVSIEPHIKEIEEQLTPSEEYYVIRFVCDGKELKRAIPFRVIKDNAVEGAWTFWLTNGKYDFEVNGETDDNGIPRERPIYVNIYEYDTDNLVDTAKDCYVDIDLFVKWTLQNGEKM